MELKKIIHVRMNLRPLNINMNEYITNKCKVPEEFINASDLKKAFLLLKEAFSLSMKKFSASIDYYLLKKSAFCIQYIIRIQTIKISHL